MIAASADTSPVLMANFTNPGTSLIFGQLIGGDRPVMVHVNLDGEHSQFGHFPRVSGSDHVRSSQRNRSVIFANETLY